MNHLQNKTKHLHKGFRQLSMRPNAHSTLAGPVVEGLGSSLKRPILAESFLEDLGSSLGGVTLAGPPVGV